MIDIKIFRYMLVFVFPILLLSCFDSSKKDIYVDEEGYTHISFFHGGSTTYIDDNLVTKYVQDVTKVKLDYELLVGDLPTKAGVLLASGEYPDMLNMREEVDEFLNAGVYIPLEDLIEEHAPKIREYYDPYWERLRAEDGHIYSLPEVLPINSERFVRNVPAKAFWIQKDVLAQAGYPRIKTLEEYFALIEDYKNRNPLINGRDTIGFEPLTAGWMADYFYVSQLALAGYPTDAIAALDCVNDRWTIQNDFIVGDITYRAFKVYNDAYKRGLINKEAFTSTKEQFDEKIASGRVLGTFAETWLVEASMNVLKQEDPDRTFIGFPLVFEELNYDAYNGVDTPNYGNGIGISNQASDPVAVIKFIDRTLYDDVQKLAAWGIEGQDYEVDADGMYYRNPQQLEAYKNSEPWIQRIRGGVSPYLPIGLYGVFNDENSTFGNNPVDFFAGLLESEKEVLEAYGVQTFGEMFTHGMSYRNDYSPLWSLQLRDNNPDDVRLREISTARGEIIRRMADLILADDFELEWNALLQSYNNIEDIDYYIEGFQKKIDDRVQAWTGGETSCVAFSEEIQRLNSGVQ